MRRATCDDRESHPEIFVAFVLLSNVAPCPPTTHFRTLFPFVCYRACPRFLGLIWSPTCPAQLALLFRLLLMHELWQLPRSLWKARLFAFTFCSKVFGPSTSDHCPGVACFAGMTRELSRRPRTKTALSLRTSRNGPENGFSTVDNFSGPQGEYF